MTSICCRGCHGNQLSSKWFRLGIQPLFGDEPTFSPPPPHPERRSVRSGFVQIDQSGIRLPRLSRRNNYINYLCLHFRIHFTFLTSHIFRDVLCYRHRLLHTTEINRLLGYTTPWFVAHRESIRDKSTTTFKNLNIFKRLNLLDECNRTAKVISLKTGKT